MTEVTIRTNNEAALQKLLEFISTVGFQDVELNSIKAGNSSVESPTKNKEAKKPQPHIQWAEEPEKAEELFGIWKDNPMTLEKLRQLAWGDRL